MTDSHTAQPFNLHFHSRIADIEAQIWDRLIPSDYPFLRHAFLHTLEISASVTPENGWHPYHLQVCDAQHNTLLVMPLYIKSHSYGEYVFDWSWADAYAKEGLQYYPKLLVAVPFTPAAGPRYGSQLDEHQSVGLITHALNTLSEKIPCSSWHGLFFPSTDVERCRQLGYSIREGVQYQWFNRNYTHFDDFLNTFSSRKRKNVLKERKRVQQQGVRFDWRTGADISAADLEHFWLFYQLTHARRGRSGYLTRDFFHQLTQNMPEQLLFCFARNTETTLAGALFFKDSTTLYGRYWGSLDTHDFLHFETCYYQGIDYAITHQLLRFDSGAQGEHKIARGFEPVSTFSVHAMRHSGFNQAVKAFVKEEAQEIKAYKAYIAERLPFSKSTP